MHNLPLPLDGLGSSYGPSQLQLSRYAAERHALLRELPPAQPARALWPARRLLARGLRSTARRLEPRLDPG